MMSIIKGSPSRHGTHLPQDSLAQNLRKNSARSTIQVSVSITTMPPDPIMEPALVNDSKSIGKSNKLSGKQPPEGPPVWTALNFLPSWTPPPMSKTTSRRMVPIGTSIKPLLAILPVRANTAGPLLPSVPIPLNQSAPLLIIRGTVAYVLTLFREVGFSQSPEATDRGGLTRGIPLLPSIEYIRALPSPQTKAPAPCIISTSKLNSLPMILLPSSLRSLACAIAIRSRFTARGD